MTLGSLFDGSGTALLAATMCGIAPVWAAEIEPYPIAVTHTHFPDVIHLGDVARIDGGKIPPVDVIVFGSPCQDMSVAGKRAGMQHTEHGDEETTRSGLFYEAVRIIREMRGATNGVYPTFAIWENVPGAFSSNDGKDFRCVLEELANIGGVGLAIPRPAGGAWKRAGLCVGDNFSLAWRVLDAQYWGVPQRRRRIYLVADFRGQRAGKILFERDGLRGHPAPGGKAQEGAAAGAGGGAANGDRIYSIHDKATRYRGGGAGRHGDGAGNGLGISDDSTMYTLDTGCRHAVCMATAQANAEISETLCPTLLHGHEQPILCNGYIVRRLTPNECCRLQGFPDGWGTPRHINNLTDEEETFWNGVRETALRIAGKATRPLPRDRLIRWVNNLHTDSAEYRMWGNGMALPCLLYVMEGIALETV